MGRRILSMAACVLALHLPGFIAVLDETRRDRESFIELGMPQYFSALARVPPSGHIALIGKKAVALGTLHYHCDLPGVECALAEAVDSYFIDQNAPRDPAAFLKRAPRFDIELVLDFRLRDPGPWTPEEWALRSPKADPSD
jgi:hypothetical protein